MCARSHRRHDLPDSVFVEDTAVVLDDDGGDHPAGRRVAPRRNRCCCGGVGAATANCSGYGASDAGRRRRAAARTNTVCRHWIENQRGRRAQLTEIAKPHGYDVRSVNVGRCLHLKSAVTQASAQLIVVNPKWVDASVFEGYRAIEVDPRSLRRKCPLIGERVLCAASHKRTNERLQSAGLDLLLVDVSELAKAEGSGNLLQHNLQAFPSMNPLNLEP